MELVHAQTYKRTMDALVECMAKIMPFMRDSYIYEVYCNPDGRIWTLSNKSGKSRTDVFLSAGEAMLMPWQGGYSFYHANRTGASGRRRRRDVPR